MSWLIGNLDNLGPVAAKTALLVAIAVVGLRLVERRTLARLRPFDVVTVVALGAIIGRTATSTTTSFLQGATATLTLLGVHELLGRARYLGWVRRFTEHRVRVLMHEGKFLPRQLWVCGLTRSDVESALRTHGVTDRTQVRYLLYEPDGAFTVVERDRGGELIRAAVHPTGGGA